MKITLQQPDNIGVLTSTLCMVHCLAIPFLFIAQTCTATCCEASPIWWSWIDYLFLTISFFAIRRSTQVSSNNAVKFGLWLSWTALFMLIIDEGQGYLHLSDTYKYVAAFTLVVLHLYNQKYCQCKNDKCCIQHE